MGPIKPRDIGLGQAPLGTIATLSDGKTLSFRERPGVKVCLHCLQVIDWLSLRHTNITGYSNPTEFEGFTRQRPGSKCQLQLCSTMRWHLDGDLEEVDGIKILPKIDYNTCLSSVKITYSYESMPSICRQIDVWAEEDSPLNKRPLALIKLSHLNISRPLAVSATPPLDHDRGPEALGVMKMWISNCLECTDDKPHSRCRDTLAHSVVNEEDSPIPAERIIDVGLDDTDNVRLALTNDTRGRYCALSHCWGPVDKRPTCVTRANEDSFFAGIEVGGLSRTFQDAILVTRGLGIRYLWIDSLCIVQDDVAHWRQESARMGSIYENAFLRIAASGATNSTEGLFQRNLDRKTSEKRPPTIDLRQKNSKQALIHFRAARENTNGDHISPLARRAWVFQESRLSRRTIFFNRPGITWECRACRMNERNHTDTVPRSQMYSWTKHVEDYSDCVLTYESDRLIALEGLASELGKLRPDTYHLGTWLGDVSGLMWRIVEPEVGMRGLPDLPSWTWASRPGRKRFATGFGPIKRADGTTSTISFQDNGRTLILEASLTECIVTDDRFVNLLRADGKGGTTPTGLVRFDDASDYQRLHCSMLGTDWNSALISQPNDILRGDTPKGENYYWALFLQPIENRQDHYRRVGIGLIWSTPDIEDYLEKQTFHLV